MFIAPGTVSQVIFGLLTSLAFMLLQLRCTPLILNRVDALQFCVQLATFGTLFFALLSRTGVFEEGCRFPGPAGCKILAGLTFALRAGARRVAVS